jgi:Mn2+/Fe2+ NRAMP family transporter
MWLVGLSLMFAAGVLFAYALSPLRISWREKTLERAAAFLTAVALLGGVVMGAIYAAHLGFAEDVKIYLIEEHSTRE